MRLEEMQGIGPGLAKAIRKRFREDDRFLQAATTGDLSALCEVDGINERRAIQLVHQLRGTREDDHFLATPAAKRIHEDLMARIHSFAATRYGRNRLRLLDMDPDPEACTRRMRHVLTQKDQVSALDRAAIKRALRRIHPPNDPPARCDTETLVVAEDDAAHDRLHSLGIQHHAILGGPRDLRHTDADLVIVAYTDGRVHSPHEATVDVPYDAPLAELCPDAVLAWAHHNRDLLQACAELAERLDKETVAPAILAQLEQAPDLAEPDQVRKRVQAIHKDLVAAADTAIAGLALSGTELVQALASGAPPASIRKAIEPALVDARQQVIDQTGIRFDPFTRELPIQIDEAEVERVCKRIAGQSRLQAYEAARKQAKIIAEHQDTIRAEVAAWHEWDADFALGCFALEHDLQPWRIAPALAFTNSVHMALAADPDAQRIAYHLKDTRVSLLTGANSGGKSTLLEHVAQLLILARLGLPTPGDVQLPWVDAVHLVTAKRGVDAGAFETFLRSFLPACLGDETRFVLADEVEAMTEPQAAGRILARFIDRLQDTQSHGIVVTHMAQAILEATQRPVRVDGLEASGLDAQHRLVVDRCPRIGVHARSTPELIVERLAKTTKGTEQALFADLLDALRNPETRK